MTYDVVIDDKVRRVELQREGDRWHCKLDGKEIVVDAALTDRDVISLLVDGRAYEVKREITATDQHVLVGTERYKSEVRDPRSLRTRKAMAENAAGPRKLTAPMPGKVVRILLPAGSAVEAGQGVVVVEAMKMQNDIKSPKAGTVQQVLISEGAAVNAGDVLAIIE